MAFQYSGNNRVTATWIDKAGKPVTRTYGLLDAAPPTALVAATHAAKLSGISAGQLIKIVYSFEYADDAAPAVATNDSHRDDYAVIKAKLDGRPEYHGINIPMPPDSIFLSASGEGHDLIDPTDAAVIAFAELFESDGSWTISDGEQIDGDNGSGVVGGKRGK